MPPAPECPTTTHAALPSPSAYDSTEAPTSEAPEGSAAGERGFGSPRVHLLRGHGGPFTPNSLPLHPRAGRHISAPCFPHKSDGPAIEFAASTRLRGGPW